jgi:hypothetical protein
MVSVTIKREGSNALKNLTNLQTASVKIGWFPSARYDDEKSTPVAAIAAQNEYGNPSDNIPPRPFIRPAIAHSQKKWSDIGKRGLKAVLAGKSTINQVLDNLGVAAIGDIQHSIAQVYSPPLKRATIEARLARRTHHGRLNKTQARSITKPLIDTGHMQATVSYELSREK